MNDSVYKNACLADSAGTLKAWAEAMAITGAFPSAKDALDAFNKLKVDRAEGDAFTTLQEKVTGYTVPKGLISLMGIVGKFVKDWTTPESTDAGTGEKTAESKPNVTLTIQMDDDDKVTITATKGKPRAARSSNGTVGAGSNISAWTAFERGVKAGDPNSIVSLGKGEGYKHGDVTIANRKNGGLCAYILRSDEWPEAHKVLTAYGKTLD